MGRFWYYSDVSYMLVLITSKSKLVTEPTPGLQLE
jgi:hypothetical protein